MSSSTVTVSAVSSSSFTAAIAGLNVSEESTLAPQPSSPAEPSTEIQTPSLPYVASEALVAFLAIIGNALVVYVFCTNRSLRRYRNYYIVGLAVADFLVGLLGIPLAILASVGLPQNLYGCLFTVSILMVLCTISILCLVAVSIDRYWATTNPFAYYRNMTTSTAVGIILICWFVGAIIGFLPLFGWYNHSGWTDPPGEFCYFTKVMSYSYLTFLYFATIVFPALLMACFYGYIYHVVLIKIRQKGTLAPQGRRPSEASRSGSLNSDTRGSTQMMRIIQSEKRREAKAAKKLGIIVLFFMICWMPLYTINCIQAFYRDFPVPMELMNFTIILSHANSALNPFLYAYHLKEFRLAMKNALCACFGRILCGYIAAPVQKDAFGAVSRSQTMPSLGNASVSTQTGKFSIKFRKVSAPPTSTGDVGQRISPKVGKGGILMTSPSRDSIFHTLTHTDRSLTSLSLNNAPLSAHSHLPLHHSQIQQIMRQHKESSFTLDDKHPDGYGDKLNSNSHSNPSKDLNKVKGILLNDMTRHGKAPGNNISSPGAGGGGKYPSEQTILEAEVESTHRPDPSTPTHPHHEGISNEKEPATKIVLHWKTSPTFSVDV